MIVLMETSRPISPPKSGLALSLQAAAEYQTPHSAQAVMPLGSRSEVLVHKDIHMANGMKCKKLRARIIAIAETPDGLPLAIERCVPTDGPQGALPAQIIGFLRQ